MFIFERVVGNPPTGDRSARRFDPDVVVDGCRNPLRATEVALGRLNREVAEQELDLLQFTYPQRGTSVRRCDDYAECGIVQALCRIPDHAESIALRPRL